MIILASAVNRKPLAYLEAITPTDDPNLISFKSFGEPKNWIRIKKDPFWSFLYSKATIQINDQVRQVWILENDLINRFAQSALKIQRVFRYFPTLLSPLLKDVIKTYAPNLTSRQILQIIQFANLYPKRQGVWLVKGDARPFINWGDRAWILLTKHRRCKDPLFANGTSKRIKLAVGIDTTVRALAVMRKDTSDWDLVQNEIALLKELQGQEGILQIIVSAETEARCYLITELFQDKDLETLFRTKTEFSLKRKEMIAIQMMHGLQNLHNSNIVHRDLKLLNIFISLRPLKIAIGDLGSAVKLGDTKIAKKETGTYSSMAPERIKAFKNEEEWIETTTYASDIWSMGLILFSLFHPQTGQAMRFQTAKQLKKTIQNLTQEEIEKELDDSGIEDPFIDLIKQMLQVEPEKRASARDIYEQLLKLTRDETPD